MGSADVVNGKATYTYTITDWNPGNYPIIAQYQETENYLPRTDTATLTVNCPVFMASFTGSPTSGRVDLTVNFTNTSTGTITGYEWDFGDGFKSNAASPSHTYTKPGVYTVKLTVKGPGRTNTQTRSQYITVKLPDLVMQSVTAPSTARRGGTICVSSRVRNSGTISTGKGFYAAFYLRSTKTSRRYYIGRQWIANLGVGVSSSKTNYFIIPKTLPRGSYYIEGVADYTKIIRETTRSNNIKYTTGRTRFN
ncbi:MAG: hypothetical protein Kow0019_12810 [Methanobacteriaceae archaeon]